MNKALSCILIIVLMAVSIRCKTVTPQKSYIPLKPVEEELAKAIVGAIERNDLNALKTLLPNGSEVNVQVDEWGKTPLHFAAKENCKEIAEFLISRGADINALDKFSQPPLYWALDEEDGEVAQYLIDIGAQVDFKTSGDWTALHLVDSVDIARQLIDSGLDPNARTDSGSTPSHLAAGNGFEEVVALFMEKGADVNIANGQGSTPLHDAAREGHKKVVELLLNNGAELGAKDNLSAQTPLHWAVLRGHNGIVETIIAAGAKLEIVDRFGRTPLHTAIDHDRTTTAKLLIDKGANLNAAMNGDELQTVLLLAARKGNIELVEYLIAKGVDINEIDKHGNTPLDKTHNEEANVLLRSCGAKSGKDIQGKDK